MTYVYTFISFADIDKRCIYISISRTRLNRTFIVWKLNKKRFHKKTLPTTNYQLDSGENEMFSISSKIIVFLSDRRDDHLPSEGRLEVFNLA